MDIRAKIENGVYDNKSPYPTKPKRPEGANKPAYTLSAGRLQELAVEMKAYEEAKDLYNDMMGAYRRTTAEKELQFRIDALKAVGLYDHPKASMAWDMAWDRGHSSGLYSVYQELEDLAELIL